ncbi:uncharacterized protein LOC132808251 [Hemiscyllium ocellatum]|uniref:uncharacterized protein LOC132808131 n=1 Tax=Hemiscyllium ocellatum TaxID=170820 RepID=UPI00296614BE|nr:uncharacterized protein LOC132808131 [Hemiscyllium ocellatum]XP_060677990.1 uncharacterized protein LOC132808133 [Hemiscyllium ocellatum]XP_060678054.1 uncharacterized protein LOC132808251 [Hemiscyllium ocellatum]
MGVILVLLQCTYILESVCQSVVQSPPADIKKECQSFSIDCVFYGGFFAYPLKRGEFFKQTETGTKRERILSGGRFVVRTNTAEKTFSLQVQDVNVKDTATYYCKAWYSLSLWYYEDTVDGSGTMVTVTADSPSLESHSSTVKTSVAGDTITLSCKYSGFCQYTVYWYRHAPGQALEYLLQRYTSGQLNNKNAAGGRISADIDSAAKITRLYIATIQQSDSAVYYCALSRSSAYTMIQMTQRTVQKRNQTND